ncbi:MAG: hypothetical protein J6J39_00165 [Clostridia bacterium]|nr:hypothetical protein [Clostridia bacterium]
MNRFYMKARTLVLSTALGKKMRLFMQKRSYKEADARKIVEEFLQDQIRTLEDKETLVRDMLNEAKTYNVGFDEYIMYHFENKDFATRRQFIPTRERALYCERLNDKKNQMIFDDKGKTYEVFKEYFKRDLTEVVGWNDNSTKSFEAFTDKHRRFIIKPFNGGNGRGIQIIDADKYDSFDKLCNYLKKEYPSGFVAEELIKQCKELAAVHPESVNTLRVFTVRFDDRIEFLPFSWRVGTGSACVDNGGSGGIFCALNNDGTVVSTSDEKGRFYEIHPNTKHPLIGFTVPRFEEAKAFAKKLAQVVPSNRYCGWDLALTENGWIMQEGNWQGGIVAFQCPMQKGYRKEMDAIMEELKL